ncbi:hypothetical protein DL96DRAFT_1710680 [Flagelloscypha sp. PMI_526]|nr:hypothetical protein DL96DRAFT_1710680 [Flagelloscypha sp. PMI_526]
MALSTTTFDAFFPRTPSPGVTPDLRLSPGQHNEFAEPPFETPPSSSRISTSTSPPNLDILAPGVKEALIGSILEVLLYGIFLPIAWHYARAIWRRHKLGRTHRYLVATATSLFILTTARFILDTERTVHYVTHPNTETDRSIMPIAFWFVYRTYLVTRKSIVPTTIGSLLVVGTLVSGIFAVYGLASFPRVTQTQLSLWFTIWVGLALATNLLCTTLITYGIYTVRRRVSGLRMQSGQRDPIQKMLAMLIESAAIYTILLIIQIVFVTLQNYTAFVFNNLTPGAIGIVFGLILLRASEGTAVGDTTDPSVGPSVKHPHGDGGPSHHHHVFELTSRDAGTSHLNRTIGVPIQVGTHSGSEVDGEGDSASGKGEKFGKVETV